MNKKQANQTNQAWREASMASRSSISLSSPTTNPSSGRALSTAGATLTDTGT